MVTRRHFLLLMGGTLVTGCAGIPIGMDPPDVNLAGIQLQEGGLFEQRFALQLRLRNPNRRAIRMDGLKFDLDLDGKRFATGVRNEPINVPGLGETVLDVSVTTTLMDALRILREATKEKKDRLSYRIHGQLLGLLPGGLPFDKTGEVPLPGQLRF